MAQGSVFRRNKTWTYRIRDGRGAHPSKGGFRTKREAEEALAVVRHELATGQHVRRSRMTVGEYLTVWLPTQNRRLAPSTVKSYRTAAARIDRHIGDIPLQELSPEDVEQLHEDLREDGLSPKSVLNTHHVLQAALRDADRRGLVFRNAAAVAQTPPNTREPQRTLSPQDLRTVIDEIEDPTMKAIVQVVARTGLRRGELIALRYNDIDLDAKTIRVDTSLTAVGGELIEGPPKTKKSRRVVAIDDEVARVLREHRERSDQERAELESDPASEDDFVFTRPDNSPVHPDGLSNAFTKVMASVAIDHDIPTITFHGLRHTHATHCLEAGINPKAVADRLGHSSVATTLDLYSHITPATSAIVANQISQYLDS